MKIYLKSHIKNVKCLNNKGFTMVEMLYAFSIFILIVSFFPLSFKYLFQNENYEERNKAMEWQVFVNQLKMDIRFAEELTIFNESIVLLKNGQRIQIDKHGTNIRRRVDNKGHEIALQQIKSLQFDQLTDGFRMTVQDLDNQMHNATMYSFIELEDNDDS